MPPLHAIVENEWFSCFRAFVVHYSTRRWTYLCCLMRIFISWTIDYNLVLYHHGCIKPRSIKVWCMCTLATLVTRGCIHQFLSVTLNHLLEFIVMNLFPLLIRLILKQLAWMCYIRSDIFATFFWWLSLLLELTLMIVN